MGSCGESAQWTVAIEKSRRFGISHGYTLGTEGRDPCDVLGESHGPDRRLCTIFLAIFPGDIPLHRPFYIGLIYGRYLQ